MVDTLKGAQSPRLDAITTWLQRADEELLYDADGPRCQPAVSVPAGAQIAGIVLAEAQMRRRTTGVKLGGMRLALHPDWYVVLRAYCAELNALAVGEPVVGMAEEGVQLYGVQIVPDTRVATYLFLGRGLAVEAE